MALAGLICSLGLVAIIGLVEDLKDTLFGAGFINKK